MIFFLISGKPSPKITWLINDQPVRNSTEVGVSSTVLASANSRTVRSDLRLTDLSRKDVHSEITCQATNNNRTSPLAATLHVDMNCKFYRKYIFSIKMQLESVTLTPLIQMWL